MWRDVVYALRLFRNSPGFTATVILLLALGIGANTLIFSAVDTLLLRKLPVRDPDSLVRVVEIRPPLPPRSMFEYDFYRALQQHSRFLTGIAADSDRNAVLRYGDQAIRARVSIVSPEFFGMLGVAARYGRTLTTQDGLTKSDSLPCVLSDRAWRSEFAANLSALNRKILLDGRPFVVVGIMPRDFRGLSTEVSADVWLPYRAESILTPDPGFLYSYEVFGRLRPGVTREQAEAETIPIWRSSLESSLNRQPDWTKAERENQLSAQIHLQTAARGISQIRPKFQSGLVFLMIGGVLLMLIVCANVGGLVLARAAGRRGEMSLRLSIGASRGRLVRQLFTESALMTVAGGTLGWILAVVSMPLLIAAVPPIRLLDATSVPLAIDVEPNLRIFGFAIMLCFATAMLFGAGPAIEAARTDLQSSLNAARSSRRSRGRLALVCVQVALSTVLLISAGLLVSTFKNLQTLNAGFDRDHVVTFNIDASSRQYSSPQIRSFEERLIERTRALNDVAAVGIASRALMRGTGMKTTVALVGQKAPRSEFLNASINLVTGKYFEAMGMRLIAGRSFRADDIAAPKPAPAVVNEAFVHRFFPHADSLGREFGTGLNEVATPAFRIIGVVSDAKYRSLREPMQPIVYTAWKYTDGDFLLCVRTRTAPDAMIQPVREILRSMDGEVPVVEVNTLKQEVDASLWSERLLAVLASIFGLCAIVLAAVGIYGLLAYVVLQRTREIGIRIALGAISRDIVRLITSQVALPALGGVCAGLLIATMAAPGIRGLLYGVAPESVGPFAGAAVLVTAASAIASAVPSWRAAKISPSEALRYDR